MSAAGAIAHVLEQQQRKRDEWLKKAEEAPTPYLRRQYRKKADMCKGDSEQPPPIIRPPRPSVEYISEPPPPPTRPPRLWDERVHPFVVRDEKSRTEYYDKKVITSEGRDMPEWTDYAEPLDIKTSFSGRNPPGTIISYRGERWMAMTGRGSYKNCDTDCETYLSKDVERSCAMTLSAATPEKEEPSYREQYVSPEIQDLRKKYNYQFELGRHLAGRIDRMQSDMATMKKNSDLLWKLCFSILLAVVGSALGFAINRAVTVYFG